MQAPKPGKISGKPLLVYLSKGFPPVTIDVADTKSPDGIFSHFVNFV